jgi:Ca2+-binding RTX toxin-like protein
MLYGDAGEDIIYGGDGADMISSGLGWDTIFGGNGCDTIVTEDGGDVIWLGDCEEGTAFGDQSVSIYGTGDNPENFTVVMDFWLESAKPWNQICLFVDDNQDNPSAGMCSTGSSF